MTSNSKNDHETHMVALMTENQLPLLLYVRSLLPGDPAARDVSQQANATIWEKRADFEPGTNFKAWAFSIARFEVLNYRKQQARDARFVFSQDLEQTIAVELSAARNDVQEQHETLKACLDKLRPQDRALLLHRYSSSSTLAAYAADAGRSVGGLKVTLHRLRTALLACIQGQLKLREVRHGA